MKGWGQTRTPQTCCVACIAKRKWLCRRYVKARTTQAERLVLAVNHGVRSSIAHDVCGSSAATAKLSKADKKASATRC